MFSPISRRTLRAAVFCLIPGAAIAGCSASPSASAPAALKPKVQTTKPRATPTAAPETRGKSRIVYGVVTSRKVIALTFDDGPDPTWTPKVLAILQKNKAPATFFMVGKMVRAHPQFAKMVKSAGFPIGSHTWSHPFTPKSPLSEIERTDAMLQKTLHIKPTLFRPPYGIMDNGLAKVALSRGMDIINWNSLGADWDKKATAATIAAKVLHGAKPGGIVLLHDGGGNRSHTVAALPQMISTLRQRGYRFVTVPELLKIGPPFHTKVSLTPIPKRARKAPIKPLPQNSP